MREFFAIIDHRRFMRIEIATALRSERVTIVIRPLYTTERITIDDVTIIQELDAGLVFNSEPEGLEFMPWHGIVKIIPYKPANI